MSVAGRVPPNDLDAEAAVLSAMLLEKSAVDRVVANLKPEQFYSEANRRIYEAAFELHAKSQPVDVVQVAGFLRDRDRLAQVGGNAYLAQIVDSVPSIANVEIYAARVKEKWRLRQMIQECQRIVAEGYGEVTDVQAFIDAAEQAIYQIAHQPQQTKMSHIRPVVADSFERARDLAQRGERITGIATGFERLDAKLAGLHDCELTIVAGRPGMGKTSFVMNVAVNVAAPSVDKQLDMTRRARPEMGVAVFSLEMPKEQLADRMTCSEGRVDLGKKRQGFLQQRDWDNLVQASNFLVELPIWIDDPATLSVLEIRAKVRELQVEFNREPTATHPGRRIGLVVIDYLQLMKGTDFARSREEEIAEISRDLKRLAKEMRLHVVALAQLNRELERRGGQKRPQLSDLRESGALEQDADNVIFIYRDEYYDPDSEDRGIAELIVAKQRNGPTGTVKTRFESAYTRFDNLAPGEYDTEQQAM